MATVSMAIGRVGENRGGARAHVNAGGDHGGGVDQGGNRGGAFHGVGQPDVQRNLRGLAARAHQQQQRDSGQDVHRLARSGGENTTEIERAEIHDDQEHREREAEIADAVHDERFVAGGGGALLHEVEADQQVAAQTHAFPADEEQQVVTRQHQRQHEEHEQVQVGEEAVVAFLMLHVAGGVDVDERADAGDDQQHDHRSAGRREIPADVEGAALDPGEIVFGVSGVAPQPQPMPTSCRTQMNESTTLPTATALIDGFRKLAPENTVDQEADERQQRE